MTAVTQAVVIQAVPSSSAVLASCVCMGAGHHRPLQQHRQRPRQRCSPVAARAGAAAPAAAGSTAAGHGAGRTAAAAAAAAQSGIGPAAAAAAAGSTRQHGGPGHGGAGWVADLAGGWVCVEEGAAKAVGRMPILQAVDMSTGCPLPQYHQRLRHVSEDRLCPSCCTLSLSAELPVPPHSLGAPPPPTFLTPPPPSSTRRWAPRRCLTWTRAMAWRRGSAAC
jgi:hypothetical protein